MDRGPGSGIGFELDCEPVDLFALEAELQAPASGRDPARIDALLDPDFREFGSSGAVYDRRQALSALCSGPGVDVHVEMSDLEATPISKSVMLLTYHALKRDRQGAEVSRSLRSSLWRLTEGRWKVVFHQSTLR